MIAQGNGFIRKVLETTHQQASPIKLTLKHFVILKSLINKCTIWVTLNPK